MKKTIVAAAVAALTAAPAFADVTISGAVQVEAGEFTDNSTQVTKSDVFFKGSEDLGNGMKAGFVIQRTADDSSAVSTGSDRFVTLSNGSMTLKTGFYEQYIEGVIGASAANEPGHDTSNEIDAGEAAAQNTTGIEFAPMAGVTVGAQHGVDVSTVYASYSNAGLTVRAAQESGGSVVGDVDAFSVEYKMDGLRGRYVSIESTGDDAAWVGVDYTTGPYNFAISKVVDDGATGSEEDDMTASVKYAMSKRTSLYLVHDTQDSANTESTIVGIKHSF